MANQRVIRSLGQSFTFTITNATAGAVVVALLAAVFNTLALTEGTPNTMKYTDASEIVAAGHTCDFVLDDGTIATNLTAKSGNSKKSIRAFRNFIKTVGATCKSITIIGSNVDVFSETWEVVTYNPFGGDNIEYLKLNEFLSVDQSSNSKIVLNDLGLDLGPDSLIMAPIGAGRSITVTFNF
nr:hypothetical protein [uncultured Draconibacterium sp.]